ncbi:hypothetical protein DCS_00975 [Drechmeria coniospora]|uniref:Uncharacterized protein n=1 Tax=Drechmeria coniospora TaxID=98403 RepID=A0A151GRZ4_DRECN|nr:hypothetical protein DCS_00975 [Drechmeria coniospora]KYK59841.1 hypothetical protein DCS_00975 [Drechmeria coniospora]
MCLTGEKTPERASNKAPVKWIKKFLGVDKERLHVGLYVRGSVPKMPDGEDEQVALSHLLGRRSVPLTRRAQEDIVSRGRSVEPLRKWVYLNDSNRAATLLVRIVVGKIHDRALLEKMLAAVPMHPEDPSWNCVLWTHNAFRAVADDGQAVTLATKDWDLVRRCAMEYVEAKKDAHRFDGKDPKVKFDPLKPATWDLFTNEERNA